MQLFLCAFFLFLSCATDCCEFYHVTTNNMLGTFRAALDTHCPHLLKLYRARKGAFGQDMESLLDVLDEQVN